MQPPTLSGESVRKLSTSTQDYDLGWSTTFREDARETLGTVATTTTCSTEIGAVSSGTLNPRLVMLVIRVAVPAFLWTDPRGAPEVVSLGLIYASSQLLAISTGIMHVPTHLSPPSESGPIPTSVTSFDGLDWSGLATWGKSQHFAGFWNRDDLSRHHGGNSFCLLRICQKVGHSPLGPYIASSGSPWLGCRPSSPHQER